ALEAAAIEELRASHRRHAHAAELIEACDDALARIGDEEALSPRLQRTRTDLARMQQHEPRLGEVDAMLESAGIQLDEAAALLQAVRDDLEVDPASYRELEQRLTRLHDLARQHRVAPAALAERRDALAAELDALEHAGDRLQALGHEIEAAAARWQRAAGTLGKARARAAETLAHDTTALIAELGMGGGRFGIEIAPSGRQGPDPLGAERVEF